MNSPSTALAMLQSALERRDRDGVNRACRSLIAARAPLGGQWRSIAMVLLENGEVDDARRAIELLLAATGNSPLARYVQAEVLARAGAAAEAHAIMQALPATIPDPLGHAYMLGTLATNLGDFDAAREHLRRAVGIAPQSGHAWLALAGVGTVDAADGDRMLALRDRFAAAPPAESGAFHYALGKFLNERGDVDAAFASFVTGAAAEVTLREPRTDQDRAAIRTALRTWQPSPSPSPAATAQDRAIFVTGLPRSGTTLVEQILAAHTAVDGGEELDILRHLASDAGGIDTAAMHRALAAGRAPALVGLYDHLLGQRYPGQGRVVDKTLLIGRLMGVVATLMPDAPVVWLRRNPLDSAWSIFRTYFRHRMGWTFDLREIAEEMRLEDELFAHWTAARPDQILAVDYEALVSDPTAIIPRIVAHCGLQLQPAQLAPHETTRTVTTASVAQVRQPINTTAIGAAESYRRHLQPFIDAYRAAGGTID